MVLASNYVAISSSVPDGLVSLGVGLIGVALARWVFVNREVRRTNKKEKWTETLPLTLVAMLIAGVMILDRELSVSASAFLGLGVGWAAVLILDVLGERVIATLRGALQGGPAQPIPPTADLSGHDGIIDSGVAEIPEDMKQLVAKAENSLDPTREDQT